LDLKALYKSVIMIIILKYVCKLEYISGSNSKSGDWQMVVSG